MGVVLAFVRLNENRQANSTFNTWHIRPSPTYENRSLSDTSSAPLDKGRSSIHSTVALLTFARTQGPRCGHTSTLLSRSRARPPSSSRTLITMAFNQEASLAVWITALSFLVGTIAVWIRFYTTAGPNTAPSSPAGFTQRAVHLCQVHEDTGDTDIDIIAIHGLGTKSPETWEWYNKQNSVRVNWIKDPSMLPSKVGKARIFTCDWPADLFQPSSLVPYNIEEIAILLVNGIKRELFATDKTRRDRPILFIASCLGGLILMKALEIAAKECSESCCCLKTATRGVIFLATPFRGTAYEDVAFWADQSLTAWAMIRRQKVSPLLNIVKRSTLDLQDLVNNFTTQYLKGNSEICHVFNFYESRTTRLWHNKFSWLPESFFEEKSVRSIICQRRPRYN